jgi:hypothetical protein
LVWSGAPLGVGFARRLLRPAFLEVVDDLLKGGNSGSQMSWSLFKQDE